MSEPLFHSHRNSRQEVLYRLGISETLFSRYESNSGVRRLASDLVNNRTEQADYGWIHVGADYTSASNKTQIKIYSLLAQNPFMVLSQAQRSLSMVRFMSALANVLIQELSSGREVLITFDAIISDEFMSFAQTRFASHALTSYSDSFGVGRVDMEFFSEVSAP